MNGEQVPAGGWYGWMASWFGKESTLVTWSSHCGDHGQHDHLDHHRNDHFYNEVLRITIRTMKTGSFW
uniref:Uncharacterized protein n=1 Tax=Ditylenchus dipsaci TaxID=166011 RepID=A0A915ES71_9BILA